MRRTTDLHILNLIAYYFKVGNVYTETRGISRYRLGTKDKIISTVLPHFNKYPLTGNKALQYSAWLKVICVLKDKIKTDQRDRELASQEINRRAI